MTADDLRYIPGRGCGRGKHDYSQDMGNYLRCTRCGSTKTKAGEHADLSGVDRRWPVLRYWRVATGRMDMQYADLKREFGLDAEDARTQASYDEEGAPWALRVLAGKVNCPDCKDGEGNARGYNLHEGRPSLCSICGGMRYLTKTEYNYIARKRAHGSPAEALEALG